ncbi:amine oxidase [Heterostelium album PN500]|uniref:Amine oxidase n=1 Tax=Heterostelium pallidum (strain ATCC 26659 / Pp 5 / PN500) TaxID=670386 RepID=D3BH26_HETP5|nr:amine oxidase [Heterostelium album PN500]EFA79410.1 amine oxidase [Heterostelium album PN500]|eukprot:XP_020431531.1 amine oxidase [Heterostelium album PN500]
MVEYDCIVIGGGLSGLQCAYTLKKQGHSVLVLEARNRFGGRTESLKVDGYWFDLGGQWMGGTHKHLKEICKEIGVETFDQYDEGKHVLELNGKRVYYQGNISKLNTDYNLEGLEETIAMIDKYADTIDVTAPHKHPKASEWDHQTVAHWTEKNVKGKDAKGIIDWFVRVCLAADPTEISFLWFLLFIKTAGSYSLLADIRGGAQEKRMIGGSQQISERLAEKVGLKNCILNAPVRAIYQDGAGVQVKTEKLTYTSKYVVVTVPPALAGRIEYRPPMPATRDDLTQRLPMGSVIKTIVIYDEPFWRKDGYSAEALSDLGPIYICYDDSSHDDKKTAIVGFIAGLPAKQWALKTKEERKQAVLDCYARWWGPKALKPRHYLEKIWKDEEYSRGAYLAYAGPGVLDGCNGALREPVGRIHWAGTETANVWIGYMEGALESGIRAAGEIDNRLKSSKPKY